MTVLDHFTSSFHWAETNFSAIWLRPYWYLVSNLVLTDVQNGGVSLISSGTYDRSGAIDGLWSVVRDSVFVGNSQQRSEQSLYRELGAFHERDCEIGELRERHPADPILPGEGRGHEHAALQLRDGAAPVQHL